MDLAPRHREVLVDVGRQRLERRDVDHPHFVGQAALEAFLEELVDRGEEGGERLARARRRGDQRVFTAADRLPAFELRRRGRLEAALPPLAQDRMKVWREHGVYFDTSYPECSPPPSEKPSRRARTNSSRSSRSEPRD